MKVPTRVPTTIKVKITTAVAECAINDGTCEVPAYCPIAVALTQKYPGITHPRVLVDTIRFTTPDGLRAVYQNSADTRAWLQEITQGKPVRAITASGTLIALQPVASREDKLQQREKRIKRALANKAAGIAPKVYQSYAVRSARSKMISL